MLLLELKDWQTTERRWLIPILKKRNEGENEMCGTKYDVH